MESIIRWREGDRIRHREGKLDYQWELGRAILCKDWLISVQINVAATCPLIQVDLYASVRDSECLGGHEEKRGRGKFSHLFPICY